jgi:hypothetical protein
MTIEFEHDPTKLNPELSEDKARKALEEQAVKAEAMHEGAKGFQGEREMIKRALNGRQTDPEAEFERGQQPVVNHQDRRHK